MLQKGALRNLVGFLSILERGDNGDREFARGTRPARSDKRAIDHDALRDEHRAAH